MKPKRLFRPAAGPQSRRTFLKASAFGTFGLAATRPFAKALAETGGWPSAAEKSKVVLIRHKKVVDAAGKVEPALLQDMLDRAVTTFAGKPAAADAWRQFFSPEDAVGLKVNTLGCMNIKGTDYVQHFSAVNEAVSASLRRAGVKDRNIIVWDRSEEEMTEAGLTIQKDAGSRRVVANKVSRRDGGDYAAAAYPVGSLQSRVSRILAEDCTALVNIAIPKTHGGAVFTCSLKNHYGTVDNPGRMHANNCSRPGIAEVNAIPIIRQKQKLVIGDALLMVIEGGPRWDRRFVRPFGGILVGTDPVAVDAVALGFLDAQRTAEGMEPLASRVPHIGLAEELGLGRSRREDIDLVTVELG